MINHLNKLTVIKRDDFTIIKGIINNTYYIIWHEGVAIIEKFDTAKDIIALDFKTNKKLWENDYKIFDLQFRDNLMAMRKAQGHRNHNRCYIRKNLNINTCHKCNDLIDIDTSKKVADNYYCDKCYHELFVVCIDCGKTIKKELAKRGIRTTEIYCPDCFSEHYFHCYNCNDLVYTENRYIGNNDENYCESCYQDIFTTCHSCEEIAVIEDCIENEQGGFLYCRNCHENKSVIKHHYYKPTPVFTKEKYENTLFIGFELEVEAKEDNPLEVAEDLQILLKKQKIDDRYYFKQDGSLSDGFEIVTHPTTLKSYHIKHKIKEMLEFLKYNTTSQKNGRCGLHFHINKNFFKDKNEINKLVYFFNRNREILTKFSSRKSNQINSYCNFTEFNICDFLKYKKTRTKEYRHNDNRYVAVNLLNHNTVEIRLFRGTLNHNRFRANLQFIDAICHFIKEFSIMAMTWNNFLMYLRLTNRYNHLEQFLKKNKLVK